MSLMGGSAGIAQKAGRDPPGAHQVGTGRERRSGEASVLSTMYGARALLATV